jgi:hypothetical protein
MLDAAHWQRGNPVEESGRHVDRQLNVDENGTPQMSPDTIRLHDVRFEYAYDEHGNWTERIISSRHSVDGLFQRESAEWRTIEYHEGR